MEERIALLQEQMLCVGPIYMFRFDAEGNLKSSNCPEQTIVDQAFGVLGCRDKMLTFSKGNDAPLWINSPIGLEWIAAAERKADEICGFCVLGPCLNTEITHWGASKLGASTHWSCKKAACFDAGDFGTGYQAFVLLRGR